MVNQSSCKFSSSSSSELLKFCPFIFSQVYQFQFSSFSPFFFCILTYFGVEYNFFFYSSVYFPFCLSNSFDVIFSINCFGNLSYDPKLFFLGALFTFTGFSRSLSLDSMMTFFSFCLAFCMGF